MGFWLIAALLTLAATLAVLLPLTRRKQAFLPAEKNDLEVYRDQLREVEADAARGMIDAQSAEQARIEISRRILSAEKEGQDAANAAQSAGSGRVLALVAVLAVPLIAWGVYPLFGKPDVPSMPLAGRLSNNPDRGSVDELVARAEAHLAKNPDDARGWDVLAPIYMRLGRPADAVNAYRSSLRIDGENFPRLLGLAEGLAAVSGGTITAEAESFLNKAVELEPNDPRPQFYLAQGEMQDGRPDAAITRLKTLLDKSPADAPWRGQVEQAIARLSNPSNNQPTQQKGPSSDDIEAASSLSTEDRQAMIEGMVQRLDESLRQNSGDVEGWKRLVRSYMILQRRDAALDALNRGMTALAEEQRTELRSFASGLGLEAQK
ncbi:MAG: c-type cytochrome biogenesis protein CcmI [Candidatus Ochrobactrum gambitense]|nr:MAG: c-type cytochrome biogenesis protein CcmI [Candidatus Ochrobactrum gambitense]WEK17032.1 MAG: c-type cytochrome biogenesis protein CcmI [Candidatus Ochrobactrum gambitense]